MKYIISRTSITGDELPHPQAVQETSTQYKDVRTFKSREEWIARFPHDNSTNVITWGVTSENNPYRIIPLVNTFYTITLDNILDFIKDVGQVIISAPTEGGLVEAEDLFHIEIYDDYRE